MIKKPEGTEWRVICLSGTYHYKQLDGIINSWASRGEAGCWVKTHYKSPEECAARLKGRLEYVVEQTELEKLQQQLDRANRLKNHYTLIGNSRALSWVNVRINKFLQRQKILLKQAEDIEKTKRHAQTIAEKIVADQLRNERIKEQHAHAKDAREKRKERILLANLKNDQDNCRFVRVAKRMLLEEDYMAIWIEVNRMKAAGEDFE